jgi:hypothetical protein
VIYTIRILAVGKGARVAGMSWRPRIVSVRVSSGAGISGKVARVVLTGPSGEKVEASWIDEGGGAASLRRAIGQATVHAVGQCLKPGYVLALETVSALKLGSRRIVTAVVRIGSPVTEEVLTGAVLTSDNPELAVVKAVLDALNRRLDRMFGADEASADSASH